MCFLFSGFSFCFWLADFQAEYLGTDMYIIFYANGVVCIVSGVINLWLYPKLGLKWLVIIVQCIAITSALFILLIQDRIIGYKDQEQEMQLLQWSIPIILFMLCLAI